MCVKIYVKHPKPIALVTDEDFKDFLMFLEAPFLLIEVPILFVDLVLTLLKLFFLFFDHRFSISPAFVVNFASFLESIYVGQQALYETDHLGRVVVVS